MGALPRFFPPKGSGVFAFFRLRSYSESRATPIVFRSGARRCFGPDRGREDRYRESFSPPTRGVGTWGRRKSASRLGGENRPVTGDTSVEAVGNDDQVAKTPMLRNRWRLATRRSPASRPVTSASASFRPSPRRAADTS